MSITSIALKFAAPVPKPEEFNKYLFIGPHPDDIEIGAGATAAKLAAAGKSVTFLICLDGRFGFENIKEPVTPQQMAEIRKQECLDSAAVLGIKDVRFLGLSDGGLYTMEELWNSMARAVGEICPDIIFVPDPFVGSECHKDHLNVGETARRLAYFAPFKDIMEACGAGTAPIEAIAYYMTAKPNRFVGTKGFTELQKKALLCHKSQFPEASPAYRSLESYLKLRSVDFGIRSFKGKAEGFRVLGRTQMHCLPEAGI